MTTLHLKTDNNMTKLTQQTLLKTLWLAVMISLPSVSVAISNIENERLAPPAEGLSGQVELSIQGKSGNSDTEDNSIAGKLLFKRTQNQWLAMIAQEYGESNGTKSKDNQFAHLRWTHELTSTVASELFTQYQDDDFTRLTSRVLIGGGARFNLLSSAENLTLAIGAGSFHVSESYKLNTLNTSDDYWRANTYISYKHALNQQLSFVTTGYYQPRINEAADTLVLLNANVLVKMTDKLKVKLSYSVKHDSKPPEDEGLDIEQTDREHKVSVIYHF